MNIPLQKSLRDQKGVALIFAALAGLMLIAGIALAVDAGYYMVTRNELQNAADAAALAAARKLGTIYEPMSYADQQAYDASSDAPAIVAAAKSTALLNKAAGQNITILDADIVIGRWNATTKILTPTLLQPDAVGVVSRRDTSNPVNGPITTIFAKALGINTMNVFANATAALTSASTIEPGNLIPIGISQQWFDKDFCDQPIKFYPTNTPEGCAGWNVYTRWPASESYLRKTILEGWLAGSFTPPGASIGDEFVFIGGTLGDQAFNAFKDLFDHMKTRDGDGDDNAWTTSVLVYKSADCSNPSGRMEVAGFATAVITSVVPPPTKVINAKVICENVEPGRGGGGTYGTKGSIPGLVQ